eukprot:Nk52_evm1s1401 gene=Nk52_evmTU1s1401
MQVDLAISVSPLPADCQQHVEDQSEKESPLDNKVPQSHSECMNNGALKGSVTCHFNNVCVAHGGLFNSKDANIFFFDTLDNNSRQARSFPHGITWGAEAIKEKKDISSVYTVTDQKEALKLINGALEWVEEPTIMFKRRHRTSLYHFFGQDVFTLFHLYQKARMFTPLNQSLAVEFLMQPLQRQLDAKPSEFGYWARMAVDDNVHVPLSDVDDGESLRNNAIPCKEVPVEDSNSGKQKKVKLCSRWKCYRTVTVGGDLPIAEQSYEAIRDFSLHVLKNLELKQKTSSDVLVGLINRKKSFGINVRNMNQLEELLEKNGIPFKSITLEDMPFNEQLRSIAQMDVVVAPHGAAVTHEIFLRDRSTVIELFPWSVSKEHGMYESIAKSLKLDYVSIIQSSKNETLYDSKQVHSNALTATKENKQEAFKVIMRGIHENRGRFDQEEWLLTQKIGGKKPNEREAVMLSEVFFKNSDIWINPEQVFNSIMDARDNIAKHIRV